MWYNFPDCLPLDHCDFKTSDFEFVNYMNSNSSYDFSLLFKQYISTFSVVRGSWRGKMGTAEFAFFGLRKWDLLHWDLITGNGMGNLKNRNGISLLSGLWAI